MKGVFLPLALMSCVAVAEPYYEPFAYEPGLLPGVGDWDGEVRPGSISIMPGSLKFEGLAPSQKNRVKLPSTRSKVFESKHPLDVALTAPWFSFLLRVNSAEGLGTLKDGKTLPLGFFRLAASSGANGPGLYLEPAQGGAADSFQLLISKRSNPNKLAPGGSVLKVGVSHLIVGQYDSTSTPHVLKIWIDPAPDALGGEEAPEPSAQSSDGNDLAASPDLVILGGGVGSPGIMVDEIRVGESWAEVTPKN